jgi:hypothetical protein
MVVKKKTVCPVGEPLSVNMESVEEGVLSVLVQQFVSITRIDKIV